MAVVDIAVFWGVLPCSFVDSYKIMLCHIPEGSDLHMCFSEHSFSLLRWRGSVTGLPEVSFSLFIMYIKIPKILLGFLLSCN
jgi:hypothetical protein